MGRLLAPVVAKLVGADDVTKTSSSWKRDEDKWSQFAYKLRVLCFSRVRGNTSDSTAPAPGSAHNGPVRWMRARIRAATDSRRQRESGQLDCTGRKLMRNYRLESTLAYADWLRSTKYGPLKIQPNFVNHFAERNKPLPIETRREAVPVKVGRDLYAERNPRHKHER